MGWGDPPEPTDARQIELSLAHPHEFATLFERHARSVHRYLVKRVGFQNAEDTLGETFVTAFRSRSKHNRSPAPHKLATGSGAHSITRK